MPHQLETSTSTVQRSLDASGGAAAKTNDVQRQELRGMGYAEGAARLAPKTVQLQEDEAAVAAPEAPVTHGVHAGESAEERDARRKARQAKIEATRKAALEAQAAARKECDKAQEGSGGEGASEGKATSQAASGDRANETEEEKKKRWEARAAKIAATKKASEEAEAAARKERDKELGGSDGAAATQGDAVDASSDVAGTPASDEHEDGEKKEKGKEKERAKKTPHRDLVPEVQDPAAAHADPTVAREQKHLRRHERKLRRVDKHAGEGDAKGPRRAWKSRNERKAKGWATVGILDDYRSRLEEDGRYKPGNDAKSVKYLVGAAQQLDATSQGLVGANTDRAAKLAETRDARVLKMKANGRFYALSSDAEGGATKKSKADSSEAKPLALELKPKLDTYFAEYHAAKAVSEANPQLEAAKAHLDAAQARLIKFWQEKDDPAVFQPLGWGGKWIFVMNAAGEIFAGESKDGVMHHSSFLAGGAVAAAGEIKLSGGKATYISNESGHYQPGPVFLWQAVRQLQLLGCDVASLRVKAHGVDGDFSGTEFLGALDPVRNGDMFDTTKAVAHLNAFKASGGAQAAEAMPEPVAGGGESDTQDAKAGAGGAGNDAQAGGGGERKRDKIRRFVNRGLRHVRPS